MTYALITAAVFTVIIIIILVKSRQLRRSDVDEQQKKTRQAGNKLKLLEIASRDMAQATSKLYNSVNALNNEVVGLREAASRAMAPDPDFSLLRRAAAASRRDAPAAKTLTTASRIFEDMSVLMQISNGEFKRAETLFDLNGQIHEIIADFQPFIAREKSKVSISFAGEGAWRCVADPKHVSRCIRAIVSQAVKQTSSGAIEVKTIIREATMRQKREVVVLVTDGSKRKSNAGKYEISPDRAGGNPFLRDDPSAVLRLNIAQMTAGMLGGKLLFQPRKTGNMTFRFSFLASTPFE
ncbi:MAG: hypothetical protein MRY74_06000 [Neomegalonema sp.]|nr:hypothetical protein [Neomegalonema sp.]